MPRNVKITDIYSGSRSILDDTQYNGEMRSWAASVQRLARQEASAFSHGKRKATHTYKSGAKAGKTEERLRSHIGYKLKSDAGEVAGVAFTFPRHGVFREYGVGRGRPKGLVSGNMSDWLSGSLDRMQQRLLDIVAEHKADQVIRTFMGIKK